MFTTEEVNHPMKRSKLFVRAIAACLLSALLLSTSAAIAAGNTTGTEQDAVKSDAQVQSVPDKSIGPVTNENPPPEIQADYYERTYPEFIFTLMVVVLAVAALSMQFLLLRKNKAVQPEDSLRIFGVTLILVGTLFFITAGFDSEQIAPALGLFGTIAGYLLGRNKQTQPATATRRKGNKIR